MLLDLFFRSTAILLFAVLVNLVLLRRRSAAERHLVWILAFAALLVLPVLQHRLPSWQAPPPVARTMARTVIYVTAEAPTTPVSPSRTRLPATLTLIWAAVASLLLARHLHAHLVLRRLIAQSTPLSDGVRLSPNLSVPIAAGLQHPVVILPESARHWPAAQLNSVLAHERMHIARGDNLAQALAILVRILYWPQPLVWFAVHQLQQECERAADDGVLVSGITPASAYADVLVNIARALSLREPAPAGAIAMTTHTQLHQRVRALLDPAVRRHPATAQFRAFAAAGMLALALLTAGFESPLLAQNGRFSGVVRDASGAAIPRARVDLRSTNSDGVREVIYTNDAGEFSLADIPDGGYDLTVAKEGFALLTQQNLRFEKSNSRPLEIALQVGQIRERVAVVGNASSTAASSAASNTPPSRIRVGGNVQSAKLIHKVPPIYPATAKQDRVQGTVILLAIIGLDGSVISVEQRNRSVDARLVESAIAAVRLWRYSPTLLNGNPVEIQTEVEVNFTLAP